MSEFFWMDGMDLFYLPHAVGAWVAAIWLIDWRRFRELLIYGLWGAFICHVEDTVGFQFGLWEYRDGPFWSPWLISLVICLSAAPLVGMWFVQGLQAGQALPWKRVLLVTFISMLPETTALLAARIQYGHGWTLFASVLAHIPTWLSFWLLHRWMTSPRVKAS